MRAAALVCQHPGGVHAEQPVRAGADEEGLHEMYMCRILMVIGHRQQRLQDLRVGQRVLDEAERRLFVQRKILLQKPVDAVALHVRVGAYDDAVVVRHATLLISAMVFCLRLSAIGLICHGFGIIG